MSATGAAAAAAANAALTRPSLISGAASVGGSSSSKSVVGGRGPLFGGGLGVGNDLKVPVDLISRTLSRHSVGPNATGPLALATSLSLSTPLVGSLPPMIGSGSNAVVALRDRSGTGLSGGSAKGLLSSSAAAASAAASVRSEPVSPRKSAASSPTVSFQQPAGSSNKQLLQQQQGGVSLDPVSNSVHASRHSMDTTTSNGGANGDAVTVGKSPRVERQSPPGAGAAASAGADAGGSAGSASSSSSAAADGAAAAAAGGAAGARDFDTDQLRASLDQLRSDLLGEMSQLRSENAWLRSALASLMVAQGLDPQAPPRALAVPM